MLTRCWLLVSLMLLFWDFLASPFVEARPESPSSAAALSIAVDKTDVKQGDVLFVRVTLHPTDASDSVGKGSIVHLNISEGFVVATTPRDECRVSADVASSELQAALAQNRAGKGLRLDCLVSQDVREGQGYSFQAVLVLLPHVALRPALHLEAFLEASGFDGGTVTATQSRHLSVNTSCIFAHSEQEGGVAVVADINRTTPYLNDIDYGHIVTIEGTSLHRLPSRLLLGPYVVHPTAAGFYSRRPLEDGAINAYDSNNQKADDDEDNTATKAIERQPPTDSMRGEFMVPRQPLFAKMTCPPRNVDEKALRQAVVSAQVSDEDGYYITALLDETMMSELVNVYCTSMPNSWPPSWFGLTKDNTLATAPNFKGITIAVDGVSALSSEATFHSGAVHNVHIAIPERGPKYLAETLTAFIRVSQGIEVVYFTRESIVPELGSEGVFTHHFTAMLLVEPPPPQQPQQHAQQRSGNIKGRNIKKHLSFVLSIPVPGLHHLWKYKTRLPVMEPRIELKTTTSSGYALNVTVAFLKGHTLSNFSLVVSWPTERRIPYLWSVLHTRCTADLRDPTRYKMVCMAGGALTVRRSTQQQHRHHTAEEGSTATPSSISSSTAATENSSPSQPSQYDDQPLLEYTFPFQLDATTYLHEDIHASVTVMSSNCPTKTHQVTLMKYTNDDDKDGIAPAPLEEPNHRQRGISIEGTRAAPSVADENNDGDFDESTVEEFEEEPHHDAAGDQEFTNGDSDNDEEDSVLAAAVSSASFEEPKDEALEKLAMGAAKIKVKYTTADSTSRDDDGLSSAACNSVLAIAFVSCAGACIVTALIRKLQLRLHGRVNPVKQGRERCLWAHLQSSHLYLGIVSRSVGSSTWLSRVQLSVLTFSVFSCGVLICQELLQSFSSAEEEEGSVAVGFYILSSIGAHILRHLSQGRSAAATSIVVIVEHAATTVWIASRNDGHFCVRAAEDEDNPTTFAEHFMWCVVFDGCVYQTLISATGALYATYLSDIEDEGTQTRQ